MFRFLLCPLILTVIFQPAKGEPASLIAPKLPIVFEPNLGRWTPDIRFAARIGDYRVLLSPKGAVLSASESPRSLSISLVGANAKAQISGDDRLRCRTNYFLGNRKEQWRTGVENYGRVRYSSVYPGIDMIYYGAGRDLEYDFVIAPGADPNRIRLRFDGLDRMTITSKGDLLVESGEGRLIEKRPVVYQESVNGRREIPGRFEVAGKNEIGFVVASYDRSRPLTIDPALSYSTLLGTSANDSVNGVKVDKNGLIYVTGSMSAGDFFAGSAYQAWASGNVGSIHRRESARATGVQLAHVFFIPGGLRHGCCTIDDDRRGGRQVGDRVNHRDLLSDRERAAALDRRRRLRRPH